MSNIPSSASSPTLQLAQRISSAIYANIPLPALEVGKQALMDFIGVTVAGMEEPLSQILIAEAEEAGGHPQATIIGSNSRANVQQAALINGSAGHAHDYDDVHINMGGHPTVPVAPVVFALGEHLDSSGSDLLTAFIAGVDVECILGRYAGPSHYAKGWHATGTLGTFGAAAAASILRKLDTPTTAAALGIAGTQAAGLKSQFGTMCKPLHAGHAAATGVQAASLASREFSSRLDILEANQGFMSTQSESVSEERFSEALSNPAFAQNICFKYHAACYLTHSSIEAVSSLCHANLFAPGDIESVEIRVNAGHFDVCNIEKPTTGLEAKFSLRFTAAMAMAGIDTSSISIFTDKLTQQPELIALADKVRVTAHASPKPESVVTLTLLNGETHTEAVNVAIPMTDLNAQWEKLERKFHTLVDSRLGSEVADDLVKYCKTLDEYDDLSEFYCLLSAPVTATGST